MRVHAPSPARLYLRKDEEMSKSLRSFKNEGQRKEVAEHRYRSCDKGRDTKGFGMSGLGFWAAADYLGRSGVIKKKKEKKG